MCTCLNKGIPTLEFTPSCYPGLALSALFYRYPLDPGIKILSYIGQPHVTGCLMCNRQV